MIARAALLIAPLVLPVPLAGQTASAADSTVRTTVDRIRSRIGIPGVSWAIVSQGRIVQVGGSGVMRLGENRPVTGTTIFALGSVSKMFTAAAAVAVNGSGRFRLNESIMQVVPGLDSSIGQLTLRQLLTHTSGLLDEPAEDSPAAEADFESYPRGWTSERLGAPPGEVFSYSNPGFSLAGVTLAKVRKQAFPDLMKELVLTPAGMQSSSYRLEQLASGVVVSGHVRGDSGWQGLDHVPIDRRHWPAGFLYSNAADLARWANALADHGRINGAPAFPANLINTLERAEVNAPPEFPGDQYGLGLFVGHLRNGRRVVWHDGAVRGYSAIIQARPDDGNALVLLTNADGIRLAPIADSIAIALGWEPVAHAAAPQPLPWAATPAGEAAPLVGKYHNRWPVEIQQRGDSLIMMQWGFEFLLRKNPEGGYVAVALSGPVPPLRVRVGPVRDGHVTWLSNTLWLYRRDP